jgi:hypothetical protein
MSSPRLAIIRLMADHRLEHHVWPTMQELADATGKCKATILEHLRNAERVGDLETLAQGQVARKYGLTEQGWRKAGHPIRLGFPILGSLSTSGIRAKSGNPLPPSPSLTAQRR